MSDPRKIKHKPEGDDSVPLPEHLKHLENAGVTAHRYGNHVFLRGGRFSTQIIDELLKKINNQESVVITVTGEAGSGKTYFGMGLAQIIDKRFHCTDIPELPPREDHGQIAFTREHLTYLVSSDSPLRRTQVILLDESHFGLGARDWQNREQKDLVNLLSAVRSRGYVLILIVLHSSMIDKIVRDFVVNFEFHMQQRGTAVAYRRWFPQFSDKSHSRRLGKFTLPLPDEHLCNYHTCLGCSDENPKDESKRCVTIRAIYERRKEDFLDKASQKAETEIENKPKKLSTEETLELIHNSRHVLRLNQRNDFLDVSSIQLILEAHNQPSGKNTAYTFKNLYEAAHPETLKSLREGSR